jgi:hypothetical protein
MELIAKWRNDAGAADDGMYGGIRVIALRQCADELEALAREWDKKLATPTISPVRFVRRDVLGTVPKDPRT